jgi:hypothetical protein
VLWRFLRDHGPCVATAGGVDQFDVVTVVPSGTVLKDSRRPRLRQIVGQIGLHTAERFEQLMAPTDSTVPTHEYDAGRFQAHRRLDGETVLLIDGTWTTGASVQSAADALRVAGAAQVTVVVVGRHANRDLSDNAERLKALPRPFDWVLLRPRPPAPRSQDARGARWHDRGRRVQRGPPAQPYGGLLPTQTASALTQRRLSARSRRGSPSVTRVMSGDLVSALARTRNRS